jgi:predicted GH43/DUF377 family glycosyl hydrolase
VRVAAARKRMVLVIVAALAAGSCGRYADFRLPSPERSGPAGPWTWVVQEVPLLAPGKSGEWDSGDVLNPSVVRLKDRYLNLYSGYDGKTWHTGVAESQDGVLWRKLGRVLTPEGWEGDYIAANGSVLEFQGELYYWYETGKPLRIALARSTDGSTWRKLGEVLSTGPRGSFDEKAVADPYVIRGGEYFYLYYLGQDRARRQRLGVARSKDGLVWEKLRANPILEMGPIGAFDEVGVGEPAVWSSGGSYWMLYTGRDKSEHRRLGLAKSADGVVWSREESFKPIEGAEDWDRAVVCDPTIELLSDSVRVWFGGGDVASPDQNLHGHIGLGILKSR